MATEADFPIPVCEARGEQLGTFVDNVIKISVGSDTPLQKLNQDDKHNELPLVEGESFFKSPSIVEVRCEANDAAPDASKVVAETSAEESGQNAEQSNSNDGDGDRSVAPEKSSMDSSVVIPEIKVGGTIDDRCTDNATGETQLSKETSNNHHDAYDASTENVAPAKEIPSLPSEDTESHTPCMSQGEELNDGKSVDKKPTEEDKSSNLTKEVTSEQVAVENEKSVEDNFNTAAEKASHENSKSGQAITTLETSNGNELSSKSDLNTSLSKEESQQNAEESTSKDGDGYGDRVVVPEMRVGDTTDDPCTDNPTGVTQLSKETSSEYQGTYDSSTENIILTKEILQETSLPSKETEPHTPCISEGEELNVQSKTTDDKSADEISTEADMSSNLTNEMTLEQFNTAGEKASHGNGISGETITTVETSDGDELQSKSDLNTSLSKEESEQNAEDSISKDGDGDGDRGVISEQSHRDSSVVTSEIKVGDATDDSCTDNATDVTELSKETSSDHHGTYDSSAENKEILQETSLPSKETEPHTPCISEGEEVNVQSKATDDKSKDEKPTEEGMSSDLTNKMTLEQEALEKERSLEDNFNTAAEKASHESSTSGETITELENFNSAELQSKSELNTSLSNEEETAVQKGDESVTTSEDYGVTSENTLSESHGDVECQTKTLEDAATDHGDSKLAEKSEECSPVQVEDSKIERDEHLEDGSEMLPVTEVSTEGTNDNVPAATDNVKDNGEDQKEAELSENEQSTSTLVKEDVQKENPTESFCKASESIEASDLSQENSVTDPLEEQSRNVSLSGDTTDAADGQKESLETCPQIISSSHEEGSMAAILKEATSDHADGKMIDEVDKHEEVLENLSSGEGHCEVYNVAPDISTVTEKTDQTVKDGSDALLRGPTLVDQPVELAANEETFVKEIQQNVEESDSPDKHGGTDVVPDVCSTDSSVVTSDIKVGDTLADHDVDDAKVVTQLSKETSSHHHGTNDSSTENVALTGEILQETDITSEGTECHTRGISEGEELNAQEKTTENKSMDEEPTNEDISCNLTNEVSEGESYQNKMTLEQEGLESERSAEDNFNTAAEEVSHENSTSGETIVTLETSNSDEMQSKSDLNSSLAKEDETAEQKSDESLTAPEDYGVPSEKTLSESHRDEACQSKSLEDAATDSDPKLAEKSEERLLVQVQDAQIQHDEHLEEESKRLPLTEASTAGTYDNVEVATEAKDEDEDHKEAELSESEQSTKCTLVKEDVQIENPAESLHVEPENIEVPDLSQENSTKEPLEEQSRNVPLYGNTIEAKEATIDADDEQKESHESIPPNVSSSHEEGSIAAVLKEATSDHKDGEIIDEVDNHKEVLKDLSTEEETAIQKGDDSVTTPVDYGVSSEKTLSESHGDVECQSKTFEEAAIDHSNPKLAEKSEENSVVQVKDSHIEHDEHLEDGSKVLPLTESSTGSTDDNILAATDKVKDEHEDHKEAELSESEQITECTLVKEDMQIENPAESLHVPLENIQVSTSSQETSNKDVPEEQSTTANLHGNTTEAEEATTDATDGPKDSHESFTPNVSSGPEEGSMNAVLEEVMSDHTDVKIIDEVDKHEEVIENLSTTVIAEEAEGNSLIKLEGSEYIMEDDSGKESEETPLPLPLAREISDASMFLHEARLEDGETKKAEFCDDERDTESMLTEFRTENREDVNVNSEDTKAPYSVDKISEGGIVDAAAEKEETVENVPTIIPNEKMEENSLIQVDGQEMGSGEHLDKENEQLSSTKNYTVDAHNDEVIVKDEDKTEDENPSGAELFDKDKNTESVLLTEEVQRENPVESSHPALENIQSDVGQCTEATAILEEQIPGEISQGIPSDETGIDAANTNEKIQELQSVTNEDRDKDLLVEVAASEMTRDINLEEEPERPALTETSKEEASDNKSTILLEPKIDDEFQSKVELSNDEKSTDSTTPKKESLQSEDHKTTTSSADIETTCSFEEQSLAENSQTIISNTITDAADKELALEHVATGTPHEHNEENSVTQVDCSEREHEERLEEDNQDSSFTEAPTEETDATDSKNINELKSDEPKSRGEESITPELESGENTESSYAKEETDVEKPLDSLQVKPEDVKRHDSSPDITKSIEEEISNTDPQEISTDKAERETVDMAHKNEESVETKDVTKDIPDCDKEEKIPIEEVSSQNPLDEASAENANDEESTKITEGCLITKDDPPESLQLAARDIETPPLSRDGETGSLDEESLTANTEALLDDNKEVIAENATEEKDETPKDKDFGKDISECSKEDNTPIEEVGSQKPLKEASAENTNNEESTKINESSLIEEEASLESLQEPAQEVETPPLSRDREISSLDEQSPIANPEGIRDDHKEEIADNETGLEAETQKDKNIANTTPYEDKEENLQVQEDCSGMDQNESENIPCSEAPAVSSTESSPAKEEEKVEKLTQEKILTADPQETCDEIQEKTADAAKGNNDVVISVPSGDSEVNSTVQVDGLQEPSTEEVSAEKIKDNDEGKIECALVKEEVDIGSLQVADADIKDTSSGQDREASQLEEQAPTTDSHETMADEKDAKTLESHDLKEETLQDKNYETTLDESIKEDSLNQVDGLLLEHEEHSEKDSEASKDDVIDNTLVREVAHVEDPTDSSQVTVEDIKAFAPCQDTGRSSSLEQILDPEDISSNKITEKIADATGEETKEAQDIANSVPQEDDSPNEQNTEVTLIKEDVSSESPQIAAEDREEPCLSEITDTNSQEEQILHASPGVCINDNEENKTTAPTVFETETPKDEVPKEMESVDVKVEIKEEEGYLQAVQMTTAVTEASNQERSLNPTAEETPCAEDLNVNKDVIGHIPEVSNYKQQDSPVMKVLEHTMTSNEHVLDSTSMESEVSGKNNDQVIGEANSCGDKMDLEKIEVLNDGPTAVPTSETLVETDLRGCTETEVQVPNVEKEAEVIEEEAENGQEKTLPNYAASEDVSEPKEVDAEKDIDSNNCKEISSSPISVASDEVSKANVALEEDSTSNSVTDLETKIEEDAPEIKATNPSSAEGQEADSVSIEENSNYAGSLPEEKSDSNEVAFMPGENKSGYESNNQSLESIAQVQSLDIISKTEETKTEEEDLKAERELQLEKDVTEDILQEETTCEKEIMKEDISSKEQTLRIKEDDEEIKDHHQGSCEEKVITDSHQEDEVTQDQHTNLKEAYGFTKNESETEMVPKVSEEADDNASGDLEGKIITNETIDRILHPGPEEQETSIEEPTAKIDNEKARDLDIACMKTDNQDSNNEVVQIESIPGRESEEQNREDGTCTSDEVQIKEEENLMLSEGKSNKEAKETHKEAYFEAEKFETTDISERAISDVGQKTLEDNEKSTTKKFSEVSSASEDIALREQPSEDAVITAEVQETKAGIDVVHAVPVPKATGVESQEVKELNDKCTEMADTSKPVETSVISTSKNIGECTEGTPLEAKDQLTKLHDLPEESNLKDTEVKMAEKDDAVILQSVRDISEDVQGQELCTESFRASNNPNPVEGDPEERIETREGQETKPILHAPVSETLTQEIEEQQLGRDTVAVHEEEKNICNIPNHLESVNGADTEKVPESSIHQSSVEDTTEHDKKGGNDLPVDVGGLITADVTEPEASPLSLKDKHVVLEADDARNLNPETLDGDKNISKEHPQDEHEVVEPSKVEQQKEECRTEERTDQEKEGKADPEETDKPSLSDLLQESARGTSQMADHSPTEKGPTSHTEDMHAENVDEAEQENTKTDEEKDDEEESHEQKKSDLGSEAPVMVDIGDADMKAAHKKSHNILSGVGSKMKHSIAKVKKAIIGKSPSPKKVINPESK